MNSPLCCSRTDRLRGVPRYPVRALHQSSILAIGDDSFGLAMALQGLAHEPQSRSFIAGFGDVAFQQLALVIHCAPQVVHLAVDLT